MSPAVDEPASAQEILQREEHSMAIASLFPCYQSIRQGHNFMPRPLDTTAAVPRVVGSMWWAAACYLISLQSCLYSESIQLKNSAPELPGCVPGSQMHVDL